ncbi:ABC transporter ATP-binding protein/permease [Pseudomonas sichuanensis]|uniref:ABC transporter ATP-binding protein n=1 Tax=Pseudomonas sichuanensis TaxID=2213015 RepID=UPI00244A822E|nr:ABC transporter ATP-binding protein [Pseudomonas sichuanensis]MDH0729848.1 ABC transporter ATP-binding protein/permease [Pseudomonas sichuanensis]MDH1582430.1 ABC transporter ATP-binding protein/permease [Pseudomonas sichuanensis]MDH1591219.1 ABC transporter ATP-binding protein/permease [Pseudomonas sichuanensis]MDH1597423.1 ABC transporter ATP-binding protein/permease [Pseudomonas sichuanensis]
MSDSCPTPNTAAQAKPKARGPISRVLAPIRGQLIVAAVLAAAGSMLTLVPLAGIEQIARLALSDAGTAADIGWVVCISVACLFAGMALITVGELLAHRADNRITHQLRVAIGQHLMQVPLGWFTERASSEVKQAMQDDIGTLHSLTAHFFTTLGRALGAVLISVVYLFAMDWRLALVSLLPFPAFFVFLRRAMQASATHMDAVMAGMARIDDAVVEFVNGMPLVKAFGDRGNAQDRYRAAVEAFAQTFTGFTRPLVASMAKANALVAPVTVLGLVLLAGMLFIALGWIEPLQLLPFALVTPGLCAPLHLLHYITHDLNNAVGAAQRVHALLDTPVLPAPATGRSPNGNEVRVEQLSHAYSPGNPVLSNLSFTLAPGTITAIVGPSGAGKSTVARLLLRFFDPDNGRITLGGVDLRDIQTQALYQHIGFVLQEVRLIHASVADNIALGRPTASREQIEAAARLANIHQRIVQLPRGYDSVIGEDAQLSGGEQQRLSIARAVLLDPPLLVLDEATDAVDADSEAAIQTALSRFAQGRTLLVIAHRLDTVMHADQILVLDQGELREQGRHAELLARQGLYARLWAQGHYQDTEKKALPAC